MYIPPVRLLHTHWGLTGCLYFKYDRVYPNVNTYTTVTIVVRGNSSTNSHTVLICFRKGFVTALPRSLSCNLSKYSISLKLCKIISVFVQIFIYYRYIYNILPVCIHTCHTYILNTCTCIQVHTYIYIIWKLYIVIIYYSLLLNTLFIWCLMNNIIVLS